MSNLSSISGTIRASNGEPLPGVVLSVDGEGLEQPLKVVTNPQGHFQLRGLNPGQYLLLAVFAGFMDWKKNVLVNRGEEFRVSATMYSESELE
ncbi:MAG: carboxypeptidase-like regulatory domain-containing protein [Crocinitomicaceae bacterium]|nr:carboxypeptidase-like regulatory domain-containing protein [Crocinitomicaceae bacterium]